MLHESVASFFMDTDMIFLSINCRECSCRLLESQWYYCNLDCKNKALERFKIMFKEKGFTPREKEFLRAVTKVELLGEILDG